MRVRGVLRIGAATMVLGAALLAYAIGNGDIVANPEVTIVTLTTTASGQGTALLQNTTTATTYSVLVDDDATCDPAMTFTVVGGNPITTFGPMTNRSVQIGCPARGTPAMRRCLHHATNNTTGTALADFMGVCLYGSTPGTLTPIPPTALDFGTVPVGQTTQMMLDVRNDGAQPISRIYLQTTDNAGHFQFSMPCNPDATYCDEDLPTAIAAGTNLQIQIKCSPQTPGTHTAQVLVGTNTFQLLATGVSLTCVGTAAPVPVLGVNPMAIDVVSPLEVTSGDANVVVHVTNAGAGTLLINDVRTVDVDTGAAIDWTYTATGDCTGQISSQCSLDAGDQVDLNLTFDPSAIGRRRATLLISYRDTLDRTREIPLDGSGLGATLKLVNAPALLFGQVPVGRTSQIDIKLGNDGNRDTTAALSLTANTTPPFTLMPATSAVVTPTTDRTIGITCAPTVVGPFMTTVTVQAADAFMSPPITLQASCEGTSLAMYGNPTSVLVGEVRSNAGAITRSVQVQSNAGPLTLTGQPQLETPSPHITLGAYSQMTTPATFNVTITPPAPTPQTPIQIALSSNILLTNTDGEMLKIPLSGKIVHASYEVAPTLDLGTFCVNQATTSSNVALVSDGTATIGLMPPTLDQSPSPFELSFTSPSTYPSSLLPTALATVAVLPKRQSAVTTVGDTLTWQTDVEDMLTATTMVSAKFINRGGAIAPPALDFGKVIVHIYVDDGQRVMIQNCNDTPLVLDPPMIRTPFSIDSPNFPSMLNPNETTTFSVGFHPTRTGQVIDTLRITSPQLAGAALEVMLVGEGVTTGELPPDAGMGSSGYGNTSFYACSCKSSRPSGLVPILLALMCVLFPRRRLRASR